MCVCVCLCVCVSVSVCVYVYNIYIYIYIYMFLMYSIWLVVHFGERQLVVRPEAWRHQVAAVIARA